MFTRGFASSVTMRSILLLDRAMAGRVKSRRAPGLRSEKALRWPPEMGEDQPDLYDCECHRAGTT